MKVLPLHSWDLTPTDAIALQKELAGRVDSRTPLVNPQLVAGADVSYNRFSPRFYAAVVVVRVADGTVVEMQTAVRDTPFPYIPGLLSFREAPVLLDAFAKVQCQPDAVLIDGQGVAHPRRLGIASHLGLILDVPTVGCAKSLLTGTFKQPREKAEATALLKHKDEVIGRVLRTRDKVKPLFISVGHKIDLASAVKLVLRCCRGFRLPEPTRLAHLFVNELRRKSN